MDTTGLSHVILTVRDAERSRAFYEGLLGFETRVLEAGPSGRFMFRSGGVGFFFYTHGQTASEDRFSEFRVGLDHLAFAAPSVEALEALAAELIAAGVETQGVERYGERAIPYVAFRDPDHIQLEYWLSPAPAS
jgi:catechol 2,3-dioxygenase-like lactoylglutathione lyase family enzyme